MCLKSKRFYLSICLLSLFATCMCGCAILHLQGLPFSSSVVKLSSHLPLSRQMVQDNTVYVVRGDFDLQGREVVVPAGCTLRLEGGCIRNGCLVGNDTYIDLQQTKPVFNELMLKGRFRSSEFPINAYVSKNLDYFYSFIQAFSGTKLYLNDDYSIMGYQGQMDGTTPARFILDGKGYKLTLYSFGAYKIDNCIVKDITIDCRNNITPKNKWKTDKFNFGLVGKFETSTLRLENVTFTKDCGFVYIRGFKDLEVKDCKEDGSYFFVYDCDVVKFYNNSIENAASGYYSIGKQTEIGKVEIHDNAFKNITGGGVILSGGVKYNVIIENNVLERVGGGGAMSACINIHPKGVNKVRYNKIMANVGATTLDIDAAREDMFSEKTEVWVEHNEIVNVPGDVSMHSMALVGLGKLYFRNNTVKDQRFYFWDTPVMEFSDNTMSYTQGFDANTDIGKMSTHALTEKIEYKHNYKNNVFEIPSAKGYVRFEYLAKAKVRVNGKGNKYSHPVSFVDQYKKFESSGDIKIYK